MVKKIVIFDAYYKPKQKFQIIQCSKIQNFPFTFKVLMEERQEEKRKGASPFRVRPSEAGGEVHVQYSGICRAGEGKSDPRICGWEQEQEKVGKR